MLKITFCTTLLLALISISLLGQEICNNCLDDDGNGLIDSQDPACIPCYAAMTIIEQEYFENYDCCPSTYTVIGVEDDGINCLNDGWGLPSFWGTADYFNTCDYLGGGGSGQPSVPQPIPSGEGAVGFGSNVDWNAYEYVGTCLDNTLIMGENYSLSFQIGFNSSVVWSSALNVEIVLFGTEDCSNFPGLGGEKCMDLFNGWFEILSIPVQGESENSWLYVEKSFIASMNIAAISIGHSCSTEGQQYHFLDDVVISSIPFISEFPEINLSGNCVDDVYLEADVSGATAYQWFLDGEAIPGATSNPYQIDANQSGMYEVSVLDNLGCNLISDPLFVDIELDDLEIQATLADQTCASIPNGSIELSIDSPNMPYIISWSNGENTAIIENLEAGEYSVTVTDTNGCFATETYILEAPEVLYANILGDCVSGTEIYVSDNIAWAVYQWYLNGNLIPGAVTNPYAIPADSPGEYYVVVSNGVDCAESIPLQVDIDLEVLDFNGNVIDILCFGLPTGSIDIVVDQGTSPITYIWSNNESSEDIQDLEAGNYSVTVTDANGCFGEMDFTVTSPDTFVNTIIVIQADLGNPGSATITSTGGVTPYSYQWSNGNTTNSDDNLSAGSYSITVTDNNGCQEIFEFVITADFDVIASSTDISCFGSCNGTISLVIDGPDVVYSVAWDDVNLSGFMPTNVCVGTYNYVVMDDGGSSFGGTITISEPDEIIISANYQGFICDISERTNIALEVSGGILPYAYSWTSGSTMDTLFNAGLGNHSVTVTDSNGCTEVSTFPVDTFPSLNLSFATTLTGCNGEADGSIDLTITGGLDPFIYQWSNDSLTEDLIDLAQGTYTVTVTDTNNCIAIDSVEVHADSGIEVSAAVSNINCPDLDDGSIFLDIIGGSDNLNIEWNIASDSNYIFDLVPGSYSVTVTNENGCTWNESYVLSQNSDLAITAEIEDNPCFQGQEGSIDIQIENSNSPYTILWNNGSMDEDLFNISAGLYEYSLIDSFGCEYNNSYVVEEALEMEYSSSLIEPGCNGASDGSITISPVTGALPLSYLWSTGDITNEISNIQAGAYYVTVTDNEGCIKLDSFLLSENSTLELNENIVHNPCYGDSQGQISIGISGGIQPYEVIWSNNNNTTTISTLTAGVYTASITDAVGCELIQEFTVAQPDSLGIIEDIVLPLCHDEVGSISVEGFGGIEPYSILWSTGATSSSINIEPGNSYEVTLTDINNCMSTLDFMIQEILEIDITVLSITEPGSTNNNGEIVIEIAGGTLPYQIEWSDGQIGTTASGLGFGTYTVDVVDGNGCTAQLTINLDNDPMTIQNTLEHNLCFEECIGSIVLDISGGILPYAITWSDGQTTPSVSNLCNGTYQATIVDDAGNEIITDIFNIQSPDQINIDGQVFDISCVDIDDGQIEVNASGGTMPFTYTWNNGMIGKDINNLGPGTYQVTVIDENDCINTSGFTLEDIPVVDFELDLKEFDCDEELTSIEVVGDNIYDYPIYINDAKAILDESGNIRNLAAGIYSLSYEINENCVIDIEEVEIINPNEVQLKLNLESADLQEGELLELTLEITSDLPLEGFTIDWDVDNAYECIETYQEGQCKTIVVTAIDDEVVEVTFTDARGCTKVLTAEIRVSNTTDVHIPNVFSPNADGINDVFEITSNHLDITINRFMIYDRWGNNVFSQQNVQLSELIPWDGMFGNEALNDGVYVYLLEYTSKEGVFIIKAGDITIIR